MKVMGHFTSRLPAIRIGVILVILSFACQAPATGHAADNDNIVHVSTHRADPIQHSIEKQLLAFKARDAAQAFAMVSHALQQQYQDSKKFMRMARFSYRVLYDHKAYQFLERSGSGQVQFQPVEVIGPDGLPSIALFRMVQNQNNGEWMIDRVIMLDEDGLPI